MFHELENNEAVLLMYLAGELPDDDRAELEQLLADDAGMRASLAELRQLQGEVAGAMARADEVALPPSGEPSRRAATTRRVSRALVQFTLERRNAHGAAARPARSGWVARLPRWAYPVAAASVVLIAWVGYWGASNGSDPSNRYAQNGVSNPADADLVPPPPTTEASTFGGSANDNAAPQPPPRGAADPYEAAAEVMPATSQFPRAVDESKYVAFSAGGYDVSNLFNPEPAEPNP